MCKSADPLCLDAGGNASEEGEERNSGKIDPGDRRPMMTGVSSLPSDGLLREDAKLMSIFGHLQLLYSS